MIEDALREKLLTNADLTDLVDNRLFVLQAPQKIAFPYVVYTVVDLSAIYTTTSIENDALIQYSVFAELYSEARTIINLIRAELENFSGEIEGIQVLSIQFAGLGVNERENDSRKAHISYDFRILLN